jgi:glycosyltransferase involved in cell wall biosynthesis
VGFGLAVRNAVDTVERCVASVLAQDLTDIELVVRDNASDDGTYELLEKIAAGDSRIRLERNPRDVGLIENVNRVFLEGTAGAFRWIGADDWLEPDYARRCVAALDADPGAVVATSGFRIHTDDGREVEEDFAGERLESEDPVRRLERMLWFFHAGDAKYDPVYSLIRRPVLARTGLIRMMESADWVLSAELALAGRFVHVPACLAHRSRPYRVLADHEKVLRSYHPTRFRELTASPRRIRAELRGAVEAASLRPADRRRAMRVVERFHRRERARRLRRGFHRWRRRLHLHRETFRLLQDGGR